MASTAVTLPSPVGGWNARDSITSMGATDAVSLTNWYANTTEVTLRYGYSNHVTGLPGQVQSLMTYSGGATDKLFAASGTAFYDVTSAGVVGAAVVTGLTNAKWQSANVATTAGTYLYCANGVDAPELYDGATWTAITGVSVPAITGVTTTTLNSPCVFKNRVWFIQTNTLVAWYLPVQSVGGAAASLDMRAYCQLGGYIVAMGTWTIDAGQGVDDYLVFVTSNGEVLVWQGTDPGSATTWAIKGVWRLGTPVGSRCLYKYQGDLLYLCQDGVLPMSGALQSSRVNPRVALSDKIQQAMSAAVSAYGSTFGWQMIHFPAQNQVWVNVPISVGSQQQYVMNTINGAWSNYEGWAANCWEILNDSPYFGGNTVVCKAWDTLKDNTSNINASGLQAFNGFRKNGLLKRFTMAKPIFRSQGPVTVGVGFNVDFDTTDNVTLAAASQNFTLGLWDSSLWDQCIWGALTILQNWVGITGIGNYGAAFVKISSPGTDIRWESTTIVFETGGIV